MTPKPATGSEAVPAEGRAAKTDQADMESGDRDLAAENTRLRAALQEARQQIAALRAEIREDPLTGLLNRRGFDTELDRAFDMVRRYGSSVALLYVDLDDFKTINDRYGHATGDMALMHAAALLVAHVRRSDIVSRIGGDEFAVMLWHSTAAEAESKARTLTEAFAAGPLDAAGVRIALGASVGVSVIDPQDPGPGAVLSRADRAMYANKNSGE